MAEHEHHHDPKAREDATRKRLADEKAAREKRQAAAFEAAEGVKPTPTQEENDLAASGVKVELEPDGSPEQPPAPPPDPPPVEGATRKTDADKTKQAEADRNRAGYSTRSAQADSTKT
jgi:hypothetical protein